MIKTVFMGTPDFAVPILKTLIDMTEVVLVVTQPDAYVGRKKVLTPSPVKKEALEHHIPVFTPSKIKTDYGKIEEVQPDLIVTCAYGQILPVEVLSIPKLGAINVHASLLPKYRGGAPIHHAIMNGEEKTGITIMYMDQGLDTGDMISSREIPIESSDTVAILHDKLSSLGASLLRDTLPSIIDGTNSRIKQNDADATYANIITREDEHIDFKKSAKEVYNQVRGLNSWPLAYFVLQDTEMKVLEGYIGEDTSEIPGKIIEVKKDAIGISTNDKIYYVTKLKPFGKKEMTARDYLNGIKKEELLNQIVK